MWFLTQIALVAVITCVVTWLVPKKTSGAWLAGLFIVAAIVDPRESPRPDSWLWLGLVVGFPLWAWLTEDRPRKPHAPDESPVPGPMGCC